LASDLIGRGTRDRRSDRWYGAIDDPFMSKGAKRRAGSPSRLDAARLALEGKKTRNECEGNSLKRTEESVMCI